MVELKDQTVLYIPKLHRQSRDGLYIFLDGEAPNWVATEERGGFLLGRVDGRRSFSDLVREYAGRYRMDTPRAWLHVHEFLQDAVRHRIVFTESVKRTPYEGRSRHLVASRLREFWFHTNNSCNLTCTHCLVSSHPGGDPGLDTAALKRIIDQTAELGVYRYYFTGGEPFIRKDIFELIEHITRQKNAELIVLTNATVFRGERLEELKRQDRKRLKLQVSLDGCSSEVNDSIRGRGTFEQITEGLKILTDLGFDCSLTSVVTAENLWDLLQLPEVAKKHGAKSIHLMWPHRRGRLLEGNGRGPDAHFPSPAELLELAREVKQRADALGVFFDNCESLLLRVNGRPGVKYDLGNACWDSLCLYSDGRLYPSAAMADHPGLSLGSALERPIRDLWLQGPAAKRIRSATLIEKAGWNADPFRFLTGGGDLEHSYFYSEGRTGIGSLVGEDPHYELYVGLIQDLMFKLATAKQAAFNSRSGYAVPVIYHAMGDGAIVCGTEEVLLGEQDVSTLHSNCVLSFDVEKPHRIVQEFYGKAAEEPQPDLCCPVSHDVEEISHIPQEVLERFYGCGSPVTLAEIRSGEVAVDLGSGGGIDCFIAAKKVGPGGKVIGVDMTDQMLSVALRNKIPVARNLGYDVVEFRRGYLERVPVDDASVDLVTSNCVINLSPDKRAVFQEMWRILKDHGRIVISDIVSDQPLPPRIRANEHLWGECIAGTLTQEEFLSELERAGLYGVEILKKSFWKDVEGYRFYSVTVRGYKYEKKEGCFYIGQKAVYRGPFKAVMDEEGHLFTRDVAMEVCTDTAAKLAHAPYSSFFKVIEPDSKTVEMETVKSSGREATCEPGCC